LREKGKEKERGERRRSGVKRHIESPVDSLSKMYALIRLEKVFIVYTYNIILILIL